MKPVALIASLAAVAGLAWQGEWRSVFPVNKDRLGPTGENPYFVLTPGLRLSYEHGRDTLTTTVLNETKLVDGVQARVVEDRETKDGELVEVTRDYYAVDPLTNDVYYFGEDVDVYRHGKPAGHEGAWLSGVNGAKFGLMMPGQVKAGLRFYQEQAPGVGMDRAEIVAVGERVVTPAATFDHCVHVRETSAIDQRMSDHKWYAPGIGLVKDGEMVLVKVLRR